MRMRVDQSIVEAVIDIETACKLLKEGRAQIMNVKEVARLDKPTFKDSQEAFNQAIDAKQLSSVESSPVYAGLYMYMGTYGTVDHFKHRETRQYLLVDQS